MSMIRVDKFTKEFLGQWHININNNGEEIYGVLNAGCFSSNELRGAIIFNTADHKDFESYYSDYQIKIVGSSYQCQQSRYFIFEKSAPPIWRELFNTDGTLPHFFINEIINNNGHMTFRGTFSIENKRCPIIGQKEGDYNTSESEGIKTWQEFKVWVENNKDKGYIFRGQEKDWSLKTSFHREGRSDLIWYRHNDYNEIKEHINKVEKLFLDAENNPIEFYSLLGKAQHHGFPTPLLDWTKSPYVASFFAFEKMREVYKTNESGFIFIYFFDVSSWERKDSSGNKIDMLNPNLFLKIIELPSDFNERAEAQKSIFMITNIEHIDAWIGLSGVFKKIAINANQRKEVMRDLESMGITKKTLFPGLDGVCAYLKEKNFKYYNEIDNPSW